MNVELKKKVEQLKNCFVVEGVPLIKSNRFTQEEYQNLFDESGAHISHFYHLVKTKKVYSDEEIADQIKTLLETNSINIGDLKYKIDRIFQNLSFENEEKEKVFFLDEIYKLIGWNNTSNSNLLVPLDSDFWVKSGSVPYAITESGNNKRLLELKKRFGAMGVREIFGTKFEETSKIKNVIFSYIYQFPNKWKDYNDLKMKNETLYSSEYNSLDELEDNVVAKKIKIEAEKFYRDKTKDFDERINVFSKYAEKETYIFEPTNENLKKIFSLFNEGDHDRHSSIDTAYIIEWWVDHLKYNRAKIDDNNEYRLKLYQTPRNYVPSEDAKERLYKYYIEKLFLEGVSEFEFDW